MYSRIGHFKTLPYLLVISPFLLSSYPNVDGLYMDVKCTQYENGDVDLRILVMGLKPNNDYTAEIMPDHNPPFTVTSKTDSDGILWIIPKIVGGGTSLDFKATVYEGKSESGSIVIAGDDDAPCRPLPIKHHHVIELQSF